MQIDNKGHCYTVKRNELTQLDSLNKRTKINKLI
jgi:hypothetical protein